MSPITKAFNLLIATMSHLVSIVLLLFSSSVWAGQLEDAVAAYNRKDYTEAVKLYRRAAEQGNTAAQFGLGLMYAEGLSVVENYAEAVKLFRLAAAQGRPDAQYNLGWIYSKGLGVPQDYAEAVRWYQLAAAQGFSHAQ